MSDHIIERRHYLYILGNMANNCSSIRVVMSSEPQEPTASVDPTPSGAKVNSATYRTSHLLTALIARREKERNAEEKLA